ncbi:MAG: hypothetical protein NVS9B15_11200 [Acidobacteriaceae bacterium]
MPAALNVDELQRFAARVGQLPPYARKLLGQAAELAYSVHHNEERTPDVAYLPELHEGCGLDVDAMYAVLHELERARLIALEGEYPFQDVRLLDSILREIAARCAETGDPLHEVVGELRFGRLA